MSGCRTGNCGQSLTYLAQFMNADHPGFSRVMFLKEHTHNNVTFQPNHLVFLPSEQAQTLVSIGVAQLAPSAAT